MGDLEILGGVPHFCVLLVGGVMAFGLFNGGRCLVFGGGWCPQGRLGFRNIFSPPPSPPSASFCISTCVSQRSP